MSRFLTLVPRWRVMAQLLAIAATALCIWRPVATYRNLKSDIKESLPRSAPSVGALKTLRARMPAVRYLGVVIDTGGKNNVQRASRFADALRARNAAYPASMLAGVQTDFAAERRFFEKYALRFAQPADVWRLREADRTARRLGGRPRHGHELAATTLALPAWLVLQERISQKGAQYVRTTVRGAV